MSTEKKGTLRWLQKKGQEESYAKADTRMERSILWSDVCVSRKLDSVKLSWFTLQSRVPVTRTPDKLKGTLFLPFYLLPNHFLERWSFYAPAFLG